MTLLTQYLIYKDVISKPMKDKTTILRYASISLMLLGAYGTEAQQLMLSNSPTAVSNTGTTTVKNTVESSTEKQEGFENNHFKSYGQKFVETDHEIVFVGRSAPEGLDIYTVPLFGGYQKTDEQLEQDQTFLEDCIKNFEDREAAAKFFNTMGWQYLGEGSKDLATYRFNMAYLLDDKNEEAYWGLGVISYQSGSYEEAIKLITQGVRLSQMKNVPMMVDLAAVHLSCYQHNNHHTDLENADELLHLSFELNPYYPAIYYELALTQLYNNHLDTAWSIFHEGYDLKPGAIDMDVLAALLAQGPDPKGIFK